MKAIKWKCEYCRSILVSNEWESSVDSCRCKKSIVILGNKFSRWIGNITVIDEYDLDS